MDSKFIFQTLGKFLAGIVIIMILVFLPIGTVGYEKGWILVGLVVVPMILIIALLLSNDPDMIRSARTPDLKALIKDKDTIILLSGLLVALVMYGLSYHFDWLRVGGVGTVIGTILFLGGYVMFLEVLRETSLNLHIGESADDQELRDTGLYGVIRHPMYAATILMFMFMWLLLGSWISFFISAGYVVFIVLHILNEEKELEAEMPGYADYKSFVKYRLIPFIW